MTLDQISSMTPFIKSGQLIPIMVAAPRRLAVPPGVPTFAEVGMPDLNRMAFYGLLGSKGLPCAIDGSINAAMLKVMSDPGGRKRIEDTGSFVVANSPEEFGRQMTEEYRVYKSVVVQRKITPDQ